jgi:putative membrane protein
MGLIVRLLVNTIAVYVTAVILKAGVTVPDLATALIVAIVLGVVNTVLKPMLILLTLPINILSLGLFTFVINAIIILVVSYLVPGFKVASFWWALLFSLVLSVLSSLLHSAE